MRSQNRKDKFAEFKLAPIGSCIGKISCLGKVSCLGLLALGIGLANPAFSSTASALTADELENGSLTSSVSISFAPASGNTTLTPTTASGASGLISVLANVGVTNSGGYSVYLGSSSSNLVGRKDNSVVIPGVSGEVSFDSLQDNTWGYTVAEGAAIPEDATYKAVATGQGNAIYTNNNSRVKDEEKTFALGFAAKIDNSLPADTYENQVTLSVVSSPYQLTLMDIDNMQDMTSAICENSPQLATKQLKDVRDGKYYWATKLADNNCWMTQNLDLDLNHDTLPLVPATSDVSNDWTPMHDGEVLYTATIMDKNTIVASDDGQGSWNLGDYYIKNPNGFKNADGTFSSCGSPKNNLADCVDYFTALFTPTIADGNINAHYLTGNYYQWNAAVAGTGGAIVSGQAKSSICSKGWRLPTSGAGGEFQVLMNKYNIVGEGGTTSDTTNLVSAPLYFVRSGYTAQDLQYLFVDAGDVGAYWSSTFRPRDGNAYYLDDVVVPSYEYGDRKAGISVRCIAR